MALMVSTGLGCKRPLNIFFRFISQGKRLGSTSYVKASKARAYFLWALVQMRKFYFPLNQKSQFSIYI